MLANMIQARTYKIPVLLNIPLAPLPPPSKEHATAGLMVWGGREIHRTELLHGPRVVNEKQSGLAELSLDQLYSGELKNL